MGSVLNCIPYIYGFKKYSCVTLATSFVFRHADTRKRGHADTRTRGHSDTVIIKSQNHKSYCTRFRTRRHADMRTRGHADTVTWCNVTKKFFFEKLFLREKNVSLKFFVENVHTEEFVVDTTCSGDASAHLGAEECVGHIGFQLYDLTSLYDFIQCNYMYMYTLLHCYLKESNWIQYCDIWVWIQLINDIRFQLYDLIMLYDFIQCI